MRSVSGLGAALLVAAGRFATEGAFACLSALLAAAVGTLGIGVALARVALTGSGFQDAGADLVAVDAAVLHRGENLLGLLLRNLDGGVVLKNFNLADVSAGQSGALSNRSDDEVWHDADIVSDIQHQLDIVAGRAALVFAVDAAGIRQILQATAVQQFQSGGGKLLCGEGRSAAILGTQQLLHHGKVRELLLAGKQGTQGVGTFLILLLADFLRHRNRALLHICACDAGNLLHLAQLEAATAQGEGASAFSGASGASDSMDIIFGILRNVVVEYTVDVIDIDAAGGNVGCNQQGGSACFEGIHHDGALGLLEVAVQALGLEAVVDQPRGQLLDHPLGVAEYDSAGRLIVVEQQRQCVVLSAGWDVVAALLDAVERHLRFVNLDQLGVFLVIVNQLHNLLRHGRREQDGLSLGRSLGEDGFDVLTEAHAEHLVHFVEDDQLEGIELEGAAAQVVHHSARSADDDVGILELDNLALDGRTAVYRAGADTVQVAGKFFELLTGLNRQLAGWTEQQHLCQTAILVRVNHLDGRDAEGSGFAGAGLGASDHIMSFEDERDALGLDWGGLGKSHLADGAQDLGVDGKGFE